MKSLISLLLLVTGSAQAFIAKDYEVILDCPADEGAPHFKVVRKNHILYLQADLSNKVQVFELEIYDRDFGHMTYSLVSPSELGEFSKFVSTVHVHNNGTEIEDPDQATVTSGGIEVEGRVSDQMCEIVGERKI